MNIVKVTLGIYIEDGGDGSVGASIVRNGDEAQACLDREFERFGVAYMDGGASEHVIEVDTETGQIVAGLKQAEQESSEDA